MDAIKGTKAKLIDTRKTTPGLRALQKHAVVCGGGGVGIYTYFTPDISLLTGPVWFNDTTLNGNLLWTIQLDINFKF